MPGSRTVLGGVGGVRFRPSGQDDFAPWGPRARFAANVAAIAVLRQLQDDQRPATADEQAVLARYGSWGAQGVWQVLDDDRPEHAADRVRLRELLSEEEFQAARRTTINAHFTDADVAVQMWRGLQQLGFAGGSVLEPGCGAGTFIGFAPENARMTGVELDPVTAQIAAALYPQATIRAESFAATRLPDGSFDATIGNVPFADVVLHDRRHNRAKLAMHNHFIVKSLALTRPGGLVAVLTSRYTMDAQNPAARRAMHELGDLVGAVRLPTGMHLRAAGTMAVTDLVVFRRREPGQAPAPLDGWEQTVLVELPGPNGPEQVRMNTWWQDHPEAVLGIMRAEVGMHGVLGLAVNGSSKWVPDQLQESFGRMVVSARRDGLAMSPRSTELEVVVEEPVALLPSGDEREGHITAGSDGTFTVVVDGSYRPLAVPQNRQGELRDLLGLRDAARALLAAEAAGAGDSTGIEDQRTALRGLWEAYTGSNGPINRFTLRPTGRTGTDGEPVQARITPPAVRMIAKDPYGALVKALETFDPTTQQAQPGGLLLTRQIEPRPQILGADNAHDALAIVLDQRGVVDLAAIAELTGQTLHEAREELADAIWQDPAAPDQWLTGAEYLSGDVRTKLDQARLAAVDDADRWAGHVAALEQVVPVDIGPGDIHPRIGAVWIPAADHQQFLSEVLDIPRARVHQVGATWTVENANYGVAATSEWGIPEMPAGKIMAHLLQQQRIVVNDYVENKAVLNPTKTVAAQEKASQMQARFAEWLWEDPERSVRLAADYNRRFNSVRLRDYTSAGDLLTLPGLAKNFTPLPHQRSAVARMLNERSVGLFHQVGAGKTAEMVMGTMELRRLRMIRKPAVVVPNHMLEQFSREWLQLYPQAMILAASSEDLRGPDARRAFIAKAATNDWDAIIMTRTAFQSIELSPGAQGAYQQRELDQIRREIAAAKSRSGDDGQNTALKRMEKMLVRAEEKLAEKLDVRRDPGPTFEETGIDYLVVDELHDYKNLATTSNIQDAAIGGSQRAQDLHMKIDYLRGLHGDRVVTGATATPLANSMTEMYVMTRYLAPERLTEVGITTFDQWAATFGEVVTSLELPVAGGTTFKVKDRFAKFINVPELLTIFHRYGDVKTAADLNLATPDLAVRSDGERLPALVSVEPSPQLQDYIRRLGDRADEVSKRAVDPRDDNMLKISSDGRKAALDMRIIESGVVPDGPTKVAAAASAIAGVWEQTKDNRYLDPATGEVHPNPGALQIVFCDLSTPGEGWNVYEEFRDTLYAHGLPYGSVRFIHEARNDREKAQLFAQCRTGNVAVLVGSTAKMGVGTNIQARAVHLVDMDAPWRPADVEQRHGRILRQGNQNPEVRISQIVTVGSFDTYMWQTLERKARFIGQVMAGTVTDRETGDIGADELQYAEVKALSSGNPMLLELAQAEQDLSRYRRLERAHATNQWNLRSTATVATRTLERLAERIPHLEEAAARTISTKGDAFRMRVDGQEYTKRADAADALDAWAHRYGRARMGVAQDYGPVADIGGHQIRVSTDGETLTWAVEDARSVCTRDPLRDIISKPLELGHITRLENLPGRIDSALTSCRVEAQENQQRATQAAAGIGKPFKYGEELAAAEARYDGITAAMAAVQDEPVLVSAEVSDRSSAARAERVGGLLADSRNLAEAADGRPTSAAEGAQRARSEALQKLQALREGQHQPVSHDEPDLGREQSGRRSEPTREPNRGGLER